MKKLFAAILLVQALSSYGQGSVRTLNTLAQLLAINPAAVGTGSNTVYSVLGQDSTVVYPAVRTFRNWRGAPYTTNIANTFAASDGTQWVADDKFSSSQDPIWWRIDMTGSADASANFQAMANLSTTKELDVPFGTIKLTQVVITNAGLNLRAKRTVVNPTSTNAVIVVAANDTVIQGFVFDNQTNWPSVISVSSNILNTIISRNTFLNWNSKTNPIMAVPVYALGAGGLIVTENVFSNGMATPNGIIGDRAGMVRAVSIESPFSSGLSGEAPLYIEVSKNYIYSLDTPSAEDSDAIVVTGAPKSWQTGSGNGLISGNWMYNVGKRGIKVSASGYTVSDNNIRNNYDGATMASGWAGSSNIRRQYAAIGSSYGSKNIWKGNKYFGGAYQQILDLASNTVSASYNQIIGNMVKFDTAVSWTNATCDGITSLQAAVTNLVLLGNDFDVVRAAFVSYPPDKNWDVGNNIFRHVDSNGRQTYDVVTNTWTTGGVGFQIGPSLTNYNVYMFTTPSNAQLAVARGHKVHNNIFDNFTSIGIIYRGTNISLNNNATVNGTGDYSVQFKVPANYYDVTTNKFLDEWWTNSVSGDYSVVQNSRYIVAGAKRDPFQWFPLEIHDNPLLISTPAFYDETYTLAGNTNVGQLAMFSSPNRPGFTVNGWTNGTTIRVYSNITYTASNNVILSTNLTLTSVTNVNRSHWEFPETFTYKSISGATNAEWYRVAAAIMPGYAGAERYGATIRIGSSGGAWGTFDQEFKLGGSFGLPFLEMTRNIPGITGFATAVRLVYDTSGFDTTCYFDVQASGTSTARWTVQVQPEFASPFLTPDLTWHAHTATNVPSLAGTETVKLAINSTANQTYHFIKGTQEYYDTVETTFVKRYLTNASATMDFVAQYLRNNGTNVMLEQSGSVGQLLTKTSGGYQWSNAPTTSYTFSTGTTNSGGTIYAALAPGANITFTTNAQTITISSIGGGSGPTNGTAVYVDGTGYTVANFVDSAELNPTYSGTSVTYAIVGSSIATNKIDSTFYNFINNKQSALTFSDGTTNDNGTVKVAIAAGSNITLSTNANTITIASTGGGGSTNGSAVFIDGTYQSAPNFADGSETAVTVVGANATYTVVANSQGTNKLTAAAYQGLKEYTTLLNIPTTIQRLGAISGSQGDLLYRDATGWTNLAKGSIGQYLAPTATGLTYSNLPAGGGGGGLGTNVIVNNVLQQPARFTNAPSTTTGGVRWNINANGDIEGYATNLTGSSATVLKLIGSSTFVYAVPLLDFSSITNTGVITNAVSNGTDGTDPLRVTFDLSGVSSTNYVITVESEATDAVWGNTWWVEGGTRGTSQVKVWIGSAVGATIFAGDGFTQRVKIFEQAVVGGSGGGFVNGTAVTNLANSGSINWTITNSVGYPNLSPNLLPKTIAHWTAKDYIPDASNPATFSSRSVGGSLVPSITFDPTTQQGTSFEAAMPAETIDLAAGVNVKLFWSTPLASAGSNVVFSVTVTNLCCGNTANSTVLITNAPSGVANEITNSVAAFPSLTSLTQQGMVKVFVARVAGSASDVNPLTNEVRAIHLYVP